MSGVVLRFGLALACALVLMERAAPVAATEPGGRCVLTSGSSKASEASAAAALKVLGEGTLRVRVKNVEPATLRSRCGGVTVTIGRKALRAAIGALPESPIVYTMVSNPGALVRNRSHVAGVAMDADPTRVFEALKRAKPGLKRIGTVFDPKRTRGLVEAGKKSAAKLGLELVALEVHDVGDALRAFQRFESDKPVDALWLLPDSTATSRESVYYALELAQWKRIPVVGLSKWYVANGALFALAPKPTAMGRRAGELAKEIAAGRNAGGGLEFGGEYSLLLNKRTATRLGLELPADFVAKASEVLQ